METQVSQEYINQVQEILFTMICEYSLQPERFVNYLQTGINQPPSMTCGDQPYLRMVVGNLGILFPGLCAAFNGLEWRFQINRDMYNQNINKCMSEAAKLRNMPIIAGTNNADQMQQAFQPPQQPQNQQQPQS